MKTAADRAITWARFFGAGQNMVTTTKDRNTRNTGIRYAQGTPVQKPSVTDEEGGSQGCQAAESSARWMLESSSPWSRSTMPMAARPAAEESRNASRQRPV